MTVTTKSALAAELGISPGRISHYVSDGMPVREDKKLNREICIAWIAEKYQRRIGRGTDGAKRARELLADGYAGVEKDERDTTFCRYSDDGTDAMEWGYVDTNGEVVVEYREEAWERLGFKSADAYRRWLQQPRAKEDALRSLFK